MQMQQQWGALLVYLEAGRRSKVARRSNRLKSTNVAKPWLCLFYLLMWTTDVGVWIGSGRELLTGGENGSFPFRTTFCFASEVEDKESDHNTIRAAAVTNLKPFLPIAAAATILPVKEKLTLNQVLYRAGKHGLGGGIPGAIAGAIQVLSLMWLRTIINYQSRYGTTFVQALRTLLHDGGVARLYCGVSFALIQAPLARFVSTAANDGIESLLANLSYTRDWGPGRTTIVASIVVGLWRMLLMRKSVCAAVRQLNADFIFSHFVLFEAIDTAKTVLQIDSTEGFRSLMRRVKGGRIGVLYSGAIANAIAAVLGHYPWVRHLYG